MAIKTKKGVRDSQLLENVLIHFLRVSGLCSTKQARVQY